MVVNNLERLSPDVRRILTLAQEDADRGQYRSIEAQHLLIALMHGNYNAFRIMHDMGLELDVVEMMLRRTLPTAKRTGNEPLVLSEGTKKTLELAIYEARRLGRHQIEIEHLLLGFTGPKNDAVAALLNGFPFTPEEIYRRTFRSILNSSRRASPEEAWIQNESGGRYFRAKVPYLPNLWRVTLIYAVAEAKRLKQREVSAEHLLFALMYDEKDGSSLLLQSAGLSLDKVRDLLPQEQSPDYKLDKEPEFSATFDEVLGFAAEETFKQGFDYPYTYHLLLGILRQKESRAIDILKQQNIDIVELEKTARESLRKVDLI